MSKPLTALRLVSPRHQDGAKISPLFTPSHKETQFSDEETKVFPRVPQTIHLAMHPRLTTCQPRTAFQGTHHYCKNDHSERSSDSCRVTQPVSNRAGIETRICLTQERLFMLPSCGLVEERSKDVLQGPRSLRSCFCQQRVGRGSQGRGFGTKRLPLESGLAGCHTSLRSQVRGHFTMKTFFLGPLHLKWTTPHSAFSFYTITPIAI